jgi:hypothetical protein
LADRVHAGSIARRHGSDAERDCIAYQRRLNREAHRVRNKPYDLIAFDDKRWYLQQVKSYLLSSEEMERAKKELAGGRVPPRTVLQVWQKNRRRGKRKRAGSRAWIVEEIA